MIRNNTYLIIILASCCSPLHNASKDDRALHEISRSCSFEMNNSLMFIGSRECFNQIPQRRMFGILIVRPEETIIILNRRYKVEELPRENSKVWIDIDLRDIFDRLSIVDDGTDRQFLIDFTGRLSNRVGIYGHGGMYSRGAVVDRLISVSIAE